MGSAGVGWRDREKRHTTLIDNNKNLKKKERKRTREEGEMKLTI